MPAKNKAKPQYPTFSLSLSKRREKALSDAADLSKTDEIQFRGDGWRRAIIDEALELYVKVKTEEKQTTK